MTFMSIGFEKHDHDVCIADGIALVSKFCSDKKLQLTPVRKRVMEILLTRHRSMGAYEILDVLREEGLGSQPPVVYRALDFLLKNGFAHKIEQSNSYTACMHVGKDHVPAFLICTQCDAVVETRSAISQNVLEGEAKKENFAIDRVVIEIEGRCPNCQAVT